MPRKMPPLGKRQRFAVDFIRRYGPLIATLRANGDTQYACDGCLPEWPDTIKSLIRRGLLVPDSPGLLAGHPQTYVLKETA